KNKDLSITEIRLKRIKRYINTIKSEDDFLKDFMESKINLDKYILTNFLYFEKLFILFSPKNRTRLLSKGIGTLTLLEKLYNNISNKNLEKIEKLIQ
ncbi:MAG: hypothetical protein Q9M94_00300, partial [Candidatus Gracilibacteria bacterium]|nr:hypothetical protein [Candidatus Gracilibacteria bacterium]